jgi:hypothetical protein
VQGENLEVVQLKAALQRHASEVASAASKQELISALTHVVDTAFSVAATQGVSRLELESRLRPTAHSRSVFRHVSELRSSVARAARDGSVRVTSHLYPRRVLESTRRARVHLPLTSPAIAAGSAKLQETVTVVTQRFLGSRSHNTQLTRVRSFTRVVPAAARDWTLDAMELRWLRTPGAPDSASVAAASSSASAPPAATSSAPVSPATNRGGPAPSAAFSVRRASDIPTVVLSSSKFRSARWLGRRPPRVPAGNDRTHRTHPTRRTTAITFPSRIELASRKELARWAVSATSQLIVERLVLPYLRRLAAQHMQAAAPGRFGQALQLALPLGLRWLGEDPLRNA